MALESPEKCTQKGLGKSRKTTFSVLYARWSDCVVHVTVCMSVCGVVCLKDLRRRLRYLSHLPLTCEFVMAELALQLPIVSQYVLDTFKGLLL